MNTWGDESVVSPLDISVVATSARKSSLRSPRPGDELGTLMVAGPEKRGVHAALAQLLDEHGVHVVDSAQHLGGGMLFQRIRFDAS